MASRFRWWVGLASFDFGSTCQCVGERALHLAATELGPGSLARTMRRALSRQWLRSRRTTPLVGDVVFVLCILLAQNRSTWAAAFGALVVLIVTARLAVAPSSSRCWPAVLWPQYSSSPRGRSTMRSEGLQNR